MDTDSVLCFSGCKIPCIMQYNNTSHNAANMIRFLPYCIDTIHPILSLYLFILCFLFEELRAYNANGAILFTVRINDFYIFFFILYWTEKPTGIYNFNFWGMFYFSSVVTCDYT